MISKCTVFTKSRIVSLTIILAGTLSYRIAGTVKMLFFGTYHHINKMILQCLGILQVNISGEIVFIAIFRAIPSKVMIRIRIRRDNGILTSFRIVGTDIGMNTHIREEMELIISLQISYETLTFRPVIFQFKQCQRVLSGICIFSIQPIRVTIGKTAFLLSGDSLPKTTECIKFFAIAIHWLCRIHRYSSSDRTTIGIAVFSHHCFGIHIKFQIIIEK